MRLKQINLIQRTAQTAGSFTEQVQAFVAQAMLLAADGLTLAEVGQLFFALIALAVPAAEELASATGEQKRAAVLEAVGFLYDRIAPAIPLPMIVQPFRAWLRVPIRGLVLSLAGGMLEAAVARLPTPAPVS